MHLNSVSLKKIGLIAGGTSYPVLFSQEARKKGVKVFAIGIRGLTLKELGQFVTDIKWVKFGNLSALITYFKANHIKNVVLAGNVKKDVVFKNIKLDPLMLKLMQGARGKSDMALFSVLSAEFKKQRIELLDSRLFLEDYIPKKGCMTKKAPLSSEWEDILLGWKVAKTLSSFDVGMTVVLKDKVVLALEAIEGTNETLKRAAKYGAEGFVVVKVARPRQDVRFELPVVGLETIKLLRDLKASVLAIESEKTLFFDIQEAIRIANKSKIAIIAL